MAQEGNDLALVYSAVPEPGTWILLIGGCFVLLSIYRLRLPASREKYRQGELPRAPQARQNPISVTAPGGTSHPAKITIPRKR